MSSVAPNLMFWSVFESLDNLCHFAKHSATQVFCDTLLTVLRFGWSVSAAAYAVLAASSAYFSDLSGINSDWQKYADKHFSAADLAEALEGEELDAAVRENADAQAYKEDPSFKVVAQVVDQEPAAELANGDADLSTTGQHACSQAEPTLLA